MKKGEEIELTIQEFFDLSQKDGGQYSIDTPEGWQPINYLVRKKDKECYVIKTVSGNQLGCSTEHDIMTASGWKRSSDLDVEKDSVKTRNGEDELVCKEYIGIRDTFDLNINSDSHSYYTNGIVSHNCGKSLTCKATANLWGMPLLRLDFGRLFQSLVGQSEQAARNVIKLAETIAPCVLWVDEIDKALSGARSTGVTDAGTTRRDISTFLTWMQEKTQPVFVVATANEHMSIPPEFQRAGRFDEVFFIDLPSEVERKEILGVLLKRRDYNPQDFDLDYLAANSGNYSGAEIEKAIDDAMLVAFEDGKRRITDKDVMAAKKLFKPLYEQRTEDFDDMRKWAETRCVKANSDPSKVTVAKESLKDKGRDIDI